MSGAPQDLAIMTAELRRHLEVLDALLTGKSDHEVRHTARNQAHRIDDPINLMSDAYYLSDGGYSRLVFLGDGEIRLSGVSRSEVVARWNDPAVEEARKAVETAFRACFGPDA